jgi:signal transduction histidine kinase
VVDVTIAPEMIANADPRLAATILKNLLDNAWNFTSKTEHARIEVVARAGVYSVKDNGVGFDPALASKMFVAFQRLHNSDEFPGTGIGLSTVHRAVRRHGGKIWAESVVGQGATFYFTLAP